MSGTDWSQCGMMHVPAIDARQGAIILACAARSAAGKQQRRPMTQHAVCSACELSCVVQTAHYISGATWELNL